VKLPEVTNADVLAFLTLLTDRFKRGEVRVLAIAALPAGSNGNVETYCMLSPAKGSEVTNHDLELVKTGLAGVAMTIDAMVAEFTPTETPN
jgi:hypothetical protein